MHRPWLNRAATSPPLTQQSQAPTLAHCRGGRSPPVREDSEPDSAAARLLRDNEVIDGAVTLLSQAAAARLPRRQFRCGQQLGHCRHGFFPQEWRACSHTPATLSMCFGWLVYARRASQAAAWLMGCPCSRASMSSSRTPCQKRMSTRWFARSNCTWTCERPSPTALARTATNSPLSSQGARA